MFHALKKCRGYANIAYIAIYLTFILLFNIIAGGVLIITSDSGYSLLVLILKYWGLHLFFLLLFCTQQLDSFQYLPFHFFLSRLFFLLFLYFLILLYFQFKPFLVPFPNMTLEHYSHAKGTFMTHTR